MSKMPGEKFRPFEAFMLTRCTPEPFKLYEAFAPEACLYSEAFCKAFNRSKHRKV